MAVNAKNWQELKKPSNLERKPGGDSRRKAVFVAEPLERVGLLEFLPVLRVDGHVSSSAASSPASRGSSYLEFRV